MDYLSFPLALLFSTFSVLGSIAVAWIAIAFASDCWHMVTLAKEYCRDGARHYKRKNALAEAQRIAAEEEARLV